MRFVLALVSVVTPAVVLAQIPAPERQKIALALSGGSALGLAHIGVIKYFEEHHIPIDYITGTSMGALVGGFFASGTSASQLEQIALGTDWNELLTTNPRFVSQPVVEKQRWNKPSGTLALRLGRHFSLPSGLSSGESIALLLSRYTAAYSNLDTFDRLPIPFRCVATDLVSGAAVVLDRGSLPKALRASMALPGVFSPVEWGDKVLVDGGLAENLPVEPARAMAPDVVIAVSFEGKHASQFTSLSSVLWQTVNIAVRQNEQRSAALADLVIRVQTGDLSAMDFEEAQQLIHKGYDAAQAQAAQLAKFTLPPRQWEQYLTTRRRRIRNLPTKGVVVAVDSPQTAVREAATRDLFRELGTDAVSKDELEYVLSGITAASALPGAYYEWQDQTGELKGYRVELMPRRSTLFLLRPELAFELSSNEPNRSAITMGASVVPLSAYKSRFLGRINVGYDPEIRTEYYHVIHGSPYFVSPGISIKRYNVNFYDGTTSFDFQRVRTAGSFRAGVGTGRFAQASLGIQVGYDSYGQPLTANHIRAQSGPFTNLDANWIYNTQDSSALPTRGTLLEGSLGYSFRRNSFPYLRNDFSTFHPLNGRTSLFVASEQASSFGKEISFYDQFTYGGIGQLEAYRYQEFHANTLFSARGGAFFRPWKARLWSMEPQLAGWYEVARLDLGISGWQTHQSTSVGAFVASPIGTLRVALSFSERGKVRPRLSIGRF
jgi:NTE family protein